VSGADGGHSGLLNRGGYAYSPFNADFHGAKWPNTAGPFSLVIGPNGAASR
jgi:hypothetical protein